MGRSPWTAPDPWSGSSRGTWELRRTLLKNPVFALAPGMSSLLYGVKATDVATFTAVAVALFAVAALACYIPARHVTRVDPITALRYE